MITWEMKKVFREWGIGKGRDEYERGLTNLQERLGYKEERETLGLGTEQKFQNAKKALAEWTEV